MNIIKARKLETVYTDNLKNKGITLISLVITIIILLILAVITISQLTGSGILRKANIAKEEMNREKAKEKLILAINKLQISKDGNAQLLDLNEFDNPDSSNYNEEIILKIPVTATESVVTVIVDKKYIFNIKDNFVIEINDSDINEEEKYVYGKFYMPQLTSNNCKIDENSYIITASSENTYNQSPYKAFDGVTTNNRDDGCWHSGEGTLQWIQIQFPYKIKINKFIIKNRETDVIHENFTLKDFKLQGSNDGENWIELGEYINQYGSLVETTFNIERSDLYTYYRWTSTSSYGSSGITIGEIILEDAEYLVKSPAIISSEINKVNENSENLYSGIISILEDYNKLKDSDKTKVSNYNKLIDIINKYNNSIKIIDYKMPNLTSDDCKIEGDNYKVTSSSTHYENVAYKAFDGVTTNNRDDGCWHSNGGTPQWIQIQFPYKIKINKFIIKNRESDAINENIAVKDFKLQGSNDGENWIELGEYINQYGSLVETTFNIEKSDLYIYYRWTSTSSYGDSHVSIGEIILNEAEKRDKPYIDIYD